MEPETQTGSAFCSEVFAFDAHSGALTVREPQLADRPGRGTLLLRTLRAEYFRPWLDGAPAHITRTDMTIRDRAVTLNYAGSGIAEMTVEFTLSPSHEGEVLDAVCTIVTTRDAQLNRLELFPAGTELHLYDIINFRNRHFTTANWPELSIGQEAATTTYSNDWQFAPHPTALLLTKNRFSLFAGFLDLQPSFGMELRARKGFAEHWAIDFGTHPHGLPLRAGQPFRTGRLRLFARADHSVHEMYEEFGRMLIEEGAIPDPEDPRNPKRRFAWWREPIYCTWNDQRMLAKYQAEVELIHQTADKVQGSLAQLNESMIRRAVATIRRERLPVRTILLDEGWSIARGDWRPHPQRFPNLRGLVDELHAQGFKVMVWWTWAEIAATADIPSWQLATAPDGSAWLNRYGSRWRDYSDPRIQDDYLKPLMRTLFSSEEGCCDLDGVKTDFLADKVHPDSPVHNPDWRGEERYFQKVFELFHTEMRRHKPDALHLGCAGNYALSPYIDLNRTYDVHSSNWLEHEERARMLHCTCPGVPVSYDMHEFTDNLEEYFASAHAMGASLELGNVLACRENRFATAQLLHPDVPEDAAFWEKLRRGCALQLQPRHQPVHQHQKKAAR